MALILWYIVVIFYVTFGLLYMSFPSFTPLGAMAISSAPYDIIQVMFVGGVGVFLGYFIVGKVNIPKINILYNGNFLHFCGLGFCTISVVMFIIGIQYYGGYFHFLNTPYTAIYEGSAENEIKDVLISTSGLLSIFSILSLLSGNKLNAVGKFFVCISFVVLLSIFIQGRRETLLLLIMCFLSYRFLGKNISFRVLLKIIIIASLLIFMAGVGLYLRAYASDSNGSIVDAINYSVLYETHFTIATLANEIRTHLYNDIPYGGIVDIFQPFLFIVPGIVFSLLGYDKAEVFAATEPRVYESKGGQFIFTGAFHSLGLTGVFIHGLILGLMLFTFYRLARRTEMAIYHFPIVALILVSIRKDMIYGVKYISLLFIFMFLFYLIYVILPKKTNIHK
ncbi:O-antigen polymerase [Brenneria tiliae]|uniref:Oligosaccharide repeat unit polymerase n=1 Tax=Brenneria tiliae TaxID=2914984 RepID=A0ABT0MZP4_9GAMM|nr:O-antigen polymerase [Brenneria tiliae]MCL2894649.1 oligosaccharide repeat unit polymerase [Brenneria tiliae]